MKKAGGGSIINLGSVSWHLGHLPDLSIYETAKAGIEGMTRALARDLGESNIRVNCVVPGAIRTPRQMKLWHTPEEEAKILAQQCLKAARRPGTRHRHGAVPRIRRRAPCALRTTTGSTAATADAMTRQSSVSGRWEQCSVKGRSGPRPSRRVWFVDIKAPAIHRFHPASGATAVLARAGASRASCCRRTPAGLIAGPQDRPASLQSGNRQLHLLHVVEPHAPNNRLNDGFVDSEGFLWFGSMDDNEEDPSGALYQLDDEGCMRRDPGYVVTNGPAESPDGRMLYHTDTLAGVIYAFDRARTGSAVQQAGVCALAGRRTDIPDGPSWMPKAASGPACSAAGACNATRRKANC